jgi:hypothetical protein
MHHTLPTQNSYTRSLEIVPVETPHSLPKASNLEFLELCESLSRPKSLQKYPWNLVSSPKYPPDTPQLVSGPGGLRVVRLGGPWGAYWALNLPRLWFLETVSNSAVWRDGMSWGNIFSFSALLRTLRVAYIPFFRSEQLHRLVRASLLQDHTTCPKQHNPSLSTLCWSKETRTSPYISAGMCAGSVRFFSV